MNLRFGIVATLGMLTGCGLLVDLGGLSGDEAPAAPGDAGSGTGEAGPGDGASAADGGAGDGGRANVYRDAVLSDKPVAYWPFDDEPGSLVAKDIVGGKNATLTGNATFGVPGIAGTAISIDDRNANLEVGDVFDFAGNQPFTIEAWARPILDQQFTNVGNKRRDDGNGWVLYFWDTGTVQFEQRWPGGSRVGFSDQPRTFATPAHVAVTWDGAKLAMYYDNVKLPKTFQDVDGGPLDLPSSLFWAAGYHGILDEIAIYDHALPAERVSAHFKAATAR